ncbi:alpha/beta hydrolase [Bradyrhizobium sp. CCBAU 45384]|uniref:alpha/beta hydrolase n=1 Tax=Bradyrhizobium sp. CCBAU 45384 TaxID=858428 RepID=UPI002304DDD8|nr:alpha/beta-hydrolase family protein [Bradyrhizobium sp. CCBAU 45384]
MLGALFFAAALTPTLIPRSYLTQGALAGGCFAIGYFTGVLWRRLWHYLELPEPSARARSVANALVAAGCLLVVIVALWRTTAWQNAIHSVMKMAPVETAHPLKVCLIALITFVVLLVLGRLFALLAYILAVGARRIIPRKVATVIGVIVAGLLFWSIANNLLIRTAFNALDSSFRELDVLFEPERAQPTSAGKTGSPASLVKWTELGRMGRRFIASGPTAAEISTVTEHPAQEPVRVYVGLAARDTAQARARLALDELKRQRGFERKILIVITPTGTGWIDPAAMDTVEYLHHGDVASVAMQYSYLNSPLSLLFQPEYGAAAARALFAEIYGYWTTLPRDQRPKLYLHGLSLGAMNSEKSAELFETIGDPIAGALWSGTPFESRIWRSITDNRNPDTPAWLPEFRDSRFVRFMNQNGPTVPPDRPWGAMRVVYLQYASDAITFFAYRDAYQAPAWMNAPRGPDVAQELRWYPIVTMLQLALDMAVATHTPMGFGHVYAPEHYVDAWVAVTDVNDWSAKALAKLKSHLAARARQAPGDDPDRGG